jgi:hypothetical protein
MNFKLICPIMLVILMGCGRGPVGATGAAGRDGVDGKDGQDAEVSIVKLCPGVTTYPSKFVEIAFCFDGKLYGTYSANGGFSTELPPGNYTSTGIGSSCNFKIKANCVVEN